MHDRNCFLTLTVSEKFISEVFPNGSLCYESFQLFLKRFRKLVDVPIRFFMCAEYGDRLERPHYHAIIFGWDTFPSDRTFLRETPVGVHYHSDLVARAWTFGIHDVATFDIGCAMYVAGYVHKKMNGKLKDSWYKGRMPEFSHSSNGGGTGSDKKRGIGYEFYKLYTSDMYRRDCVVLPGGAELPIPRYYDKLHAFYHPGHMGKIKRERELPDPIRDAESTPDRLAIRKHIHEAMLNQKRRPIH